MFVKNLEKALQQEAYVAVTSSSAGDKKRKADRLMTTTQRKIKRGAAECYSISALFKHDAAAE